MPQHFTFKLFPRISTPTLDLALNDHHSWTLAGQGQDFDINPEAYSNALSNDVKSIFDSSFHVSQFLVDESTYSCLESSNLMLTEKPSFPLIIPSDAFVYRYANPDQDEILDHTHLEHTLDRHPDLANLFNMRKWPRKQQMALVNALSNGLEVNFKYIPDLLTVLDDEALGPETIVNLVETIVVETNRMAPRAFKDLPEIIKCLSEQGWPMLLQIAFLRKYFHAARTGSIGGLKFIRPVIESLGRSNWSFVEQSKFLLLLCSKNPAGITEIFHSLPEAITALHGFDLSKANQHDIFVNIIETGYLSPAAVFNGLPAMLDALKPLDWDLDQKLGMVFLFAKRLGSEFVSATKFIKPVFETLNSLKYEYEEQIVLCGSICSESIPASLILMDVPDVFRALHQAKWLVNQQTTLLALITKNSSFDVGSVLKTVPHVLSSVNLRPHIKDPIQFVQEFYSSISYDFKSGCEININIALCELYKQLDASDELLASDVAYTVMKEVNRFNSEPGHIEKTLPRLQSNMIRLASIVDLSIGTQVFKSVPGGNIGLIDKYKQLAEDISLLVDNNKWGVLRETIHNRPSSGDKQLLNEYRQRAEIQDNKLALKFIDEALEIFSRLYEQYFDQSEFKMTLGHSVSRDLNWMSDTNSLQQLGHLAVSVRKTFEERKDISEKSRYELIRLMISIDHFAYAQCSLGSEEKNNLGSSLQREKIACLLRVAYGCGYGKEGLIHLAERIDRIDQNGNWDMSELEILRSYSSLIYRLLQDFEHRFRETFAPMIQYYGDDLNVPAAIRPGFSSNKYRATGLFNLDNHLNMLNVTGANERLTKQVLMLLGQEEKFEFSTLDYHQSEFPQNRLVVGGKGLGLNFLARHHPEHVPYGFVLPSRPAGYRLTQSNKDVIRDAIAKLEERTGQKLGDGLTVSVRSGGPVSMPGAMETKLFVDNLESIFVNVESVYQSWNSPSARAYRKQNGVPEDWGTAVNIVQMVRGDFDSMSGSGIVVSNFELSYACQTCGDKLADGVEEGNDKLRPEIAIQLSQFISEFEQDLGYPVEVEFTVQSNYLYLLQIRRANLTREQEISWYAKRVLDLIIAKKAAIKALGGRHRLEKDLEVTVVNNTDNIHPLAAGAFGEGQPYTGKLALNTTDIADGISNGEQVIYVTDDPDARRSTADALLAGAFIVSGGGQLAHLFSVARDQHLSFVAGAGFMIDNHNRTVHFGEHNLAAGDVITIDPAMNKIYPGRLPISTGLSPVRVYIHALLSDDELAR